MFRKLFTTGLAAALLITTASPAFAQRGRAGGGRGAVGAVGAYRGGYNNGYHDNHNNWGGFGTGLAIGAGLGAIGGYGYGSPYYGGYGYSSPYYYSDPGYAYTAPQTSYYSGPAVDMSPSMPMNRNNAALINIHVPANAQLFFGDQAAVASQTGPERQFISPPLEPGSNYQYQLRAVWNENGQQRMQTRTVNVHANDVVNVDFTRGG